jgi:flavin reductase (DIM6/NTAB) family NADH-FMN oxidoreductase RutF
MIYPVPAVMVSCGSVEQNYNIVTVAWTGTVCTDPAMTYISLRPSRYSFEIIDTTDEFVINITTKKLVRATDWCGVKSGREYNKFEEMGLTPQKGQFVSCPIIKESPINIECKVVEKKPLGTHIMLLAEVLGVQADKEYMDENGAFHLDRAEPIAYSHGKYYVLGEQLGHFGYSIKK